MEHKSVSAAISFPTGVISLDVALGGGLLSGATEIFGAESSGKTTLLIEMIRSAQAYGHETALCPSEFLDLVYFRNLGVDLSKLIVIRGRGDDVLAEAGRFLLSKGKRALFIDSATGLRPRDDQFGAWRHMLGSWISAVQPRISVDSALVMTNQVRVKRSIHPSKMFAGGVDSTAQKIARMFDTRISLSRDEVTDTRYNLVIDIVSNVLRTPAKLLMVPVVKGRGIDVWRDIVKVASAVGVLELSGSWYSYGGDSICQGEETMARLLESDDSGRVIVEETLRKLRG
jgi:recombination protein RecA